MKILRTDKSDFELFKSKDQRSFPGSLKKKANADEFRKFLEQAISDQNVDWEEFKVHLPKHEKFWDNGYEDLE